MVGFAATGVLMFTATPVAVFGTSDELLKLLENLPPDEPRSKLEPFRAIILRN